MLFQVLSHLPPVDLLNVKLVSRRFYRLVTSPQAWASAFSRFFPGPDALRSSADAQAHRSGETLRSEQRFFTRLSPSASWSSEYLTRTRLLRCVERGKPAMPFASPTPGKAGKGSPTFTFSSRLIHGCTALDADFGTPFDKRKPQFIHGFAPSGGVTSSDRKGKFDAWGFSSRVAFRHFAETHPGFRMWGLGQGTVVGVPNAMDVSQPFGMVYGEGMPGGTVYHLGASDKHGAILTPFLNAPIPDFNIPRMMQDAQATCSVWIAKSPALPSLTRGMIGLLAGSSNGVLSAFSLGSPSKFDQRFDRGQLTARWLLSPGVPIVAISVDERCTQERVDDGRICAVALNALGELFYLRSLPHVASVNTSEFQQEEISQEILAWESGRTARWHVLNPAIRSDNFGDAPKVDVDPEYFPAEIFGSRSGQMHVKVQQRYLAMTPAEMRARFPGWDMRRALQVDYANCDGQGAGELILVSRRGYEEGEAADITRYLRHRVTASSIPDAETTQASSAEEGSNSNSWSFASVPREEPLGLTDSITTLKPIATAAPAVELDDWRLSTFAFGNYKNIVITATAMDDSTMARSLPSEDEGLRKARGKNAPDKAPSACSVNSANIPGQRARFFAVGTATGTVLLWNARASASNFSDVTNVVTPLRVIHTQSPGIASLALSALYLVHGGEEGLVQAWDPLASAEEPLRTISSRYGMSHRRRAVIAAQQNPGQFLPSAARTRLEASAICLDPDSHVLRGVVAYSSMIKYWSYSSLPLAEDLSRSQQRRLKRSRAGPLGVLNSDPYHGRGSRSNPRGIIHQELANRRLDEQLQKHEEREERRTNARFGLDLLGADASEEEMLAYAKILSEEENEREKQRLAAAYAKERGLAASEELEAQKLALSDSDAEKWKFASWEERYRMVPSNSLALSGGEDVATPTKADDQVDEELKRALELSLQDSVSSAPSSARPSVSSIQPDSDYDPDLAEAIALSMSSTDATSSPPAGSPSNLRSSSGGEEDDLARAIKASLQNGHDTPTMSSRRPSVMDDDSFPALSSSPSPHSSPALGGVWGSVRDKGKARR